MNRGVAPLHGGSKGLEVADVPLNNLDWQPGDAITAAPRPEETYDLVTGLRQIAHDDRADEAIPSCDEDPHAAISGS